MTTTLTIDGKEITIADGLTVIQACEIAGVEIPRFCYHERLAIAGNCRMCLVEVEKSPKPVASCAMPASNGMVVHTNTPLVKKAREGVMEFLLINHPLDCPICDQGGECDLQDQAMAYGKGTNRFHENKRAVEDKYMGPLIETHMTRCIHCTRCIRFATNIAGVEELGAIGRGEHMSVGTYVEKAITSELSGNMIDICPVGALTSKPFAFKARPWELKHTSSIDILDAVGSNIRIDTRSLEVMRILPRVNEEINEEWISDKTRFAYDGLKSQRLDQPMIKKDGKLIPASWEEAYDVIKNKMVNTKPNALYAIAGDLTDCESMTILKDLMNKLGSNNHESRQDGMILSSGDRINYLFNTSIQSIEKADLCLIIGADPRYEATMINARLRKRYLMGNFEVANIGPELDLTYDTIELGNDISILKNIYYGNHEFSKKLQDAKNPMIIVGANALNREDSKQIIAVIGEICNKFNMIRDDWNGYNILHKVASRVGGLDLGFTIENSNINDMLNAISNNEESIVYLLGADEIDMKKLSNAFVIYQGHHGDKGAHTADVILPGAAYTEKNATYVNLEGRVQRTNMAIPPIGQAKEDWKIIRDLALYLDIQLGYNSLSEVRERMIEINKNFRNKDVLIPESVKKLTVDSVPNLNSSEIEFDSNNYYMTDPITRCSKIMANCINLINKKQAA